MNQTVYLGVMLGVIVLVFAWVTPALIRKKCSECGARNSLDAKVCAKCAASFPNDE